MSHAIVFNGPINRQTVSAITSTILDMTRMAGFRSLEIHLSSSGGDTSHAFALCGFLATLSVPWSIRGVGNIDSMATAVFLTANRRTLRTGSRLLVHQLHWTYAAGKVHHREMREHVLHLDNDRDRLLALFRRRMNLSAEAFDALQLLEQPRIFQSEEAVALGIADAVDDSTFPARTIVANINWQDT